MRIIICNEVIVVQLIYAHLVCELNLKTPPLMLLYSLIIFIVLFWLFIHLSINNP